MFSRFVLSGAMLLCAAVAWAGNGPELPPLTSVASGPRLPGKFVWADLVTDDVQATQNFYAGLFGWTFRNVGDYVTVFNDERPLAGIFHRAKPVNDSKARPRWFGYISVGNMEKVQNAVTKSGGRVLAAPQKMPKRGEQGVFADAEGAIFGAVKSSTGDPQDFLPEPGDWIWIQLLSHDAKRAADFYHAVAGYDVIENTASNRMSDFVLASQGFARATVREIPTAYKSEIKANWLPFVRVRSITESVAKAEQLHGQILLAPRPERFEGKVAVVADPTGAAIGLLEWTGKTEKGMK